ncbi:alkylation response protein AidB-like acyl-CoA dehydrogenase [Williamsia limnetica]|uniref:Alkylation response protein AidB-like acyl-CoA dehydrogenase n=1 Tax=Williamsia limnetica TaxID=882452 RepID=A0A318REB4_WILLI|nr:acyl-CoA dehydrogenase [Williamsia limnetica]PYE12341.1 alkylation response protein AidB-like acyl-CoA dehydrogenase [Williamsia limnetica]
MHWELSEEQQLFSTSLREWTASKFPLDTIRGALDTGDSASFTSALVGEGWWGVGHPEEDGGEGGGLLELALASREYSRAAAPNSAWLAAAIVAPVLAGDNLAELVAGERTWVPVVRSDRIPAPGDVSFSEGRISGTIAHVLAASEADVFVVPILTETGTIVVRADAAAAEITADRLLDRSRSSATVSFTDAPAAILPEQPDGLAAMATRAAVLVAADALGSCERMLELAVEYSKQRKQFGQFIGSFQAVKHAAAQMLVTVESGFSVALYAAAAADAGLDDAATTAAVAKAQVTEHAVESADSALTVHGAIGYTWEHELQLHYKRVKLDRVLYGTPASWNERIAAALLADSA